jgi:hypothetical protein
MEIGRKRPGILGVKPISIFAMTFIHFLTFIPYEKWRIDFVGQLH